MANYINIQRQHVILKLLKTCKDLSTSDLKAMGLFSATR